MATLTLTAAETYASSTNVIVRAFAVDDTTATANVIVSFRDATTNERRQARYDIPQNPAAPGTEYIDFLAALGTVAPGETGTVRNKANFRILNYLSVTYPRISGTVA